VAGIRSTGVTASLGISLYVAKLITQHFPHLPLDLKPDNIEINQGWPSVSPVDSPNGVIEVDGVQHKISHPLTLLGWAKL